MSPKDEITVGLSSKTHKVLRQLKEEGIFNEMRDAYRFGIALAIARGKIVPGSTKIDSTYVNVGSLDPSGIIKDMIIELFPDAVDQPYRYAERLAEWGVAEMGRISQSSELKFRDIFSSIAEQT